MTTIKFRNSFVSFAALTTMLLISSCGGETDSNDTTTMPATADSATVAASDNTAVKPLVKKKKGKATVIIINKENGMKVEKDKDGIYSNAEVMPEYPGGEAALSTFVERNIEYPQNAVDADTEGTVNVSFVIDEKGKVVKPVAGGNTVGNGLEDEAVKIVGKLPDWKPGMVKGKAVKTRLTLPITFKLADS